MSNLKGGITDFQKHIIKQLESLMVGNSVDAMYKMLEEGKDDSDGDYKPDVVEVDDDDDEDIEKGFVMIE